MKYRFIIRIKLDVFSESLVEEGMMLKLNKLRIKGIDRLHLDWVYYGNDFYYSQDAFDYMKLIFKRSKKPEIILKEIINATKSTSNHFLKICKKLSKQKYSKYNLKKKNFEYCKAFYGVGALIPIPFLIEDPLADIIAERVEKETGIKDVRRLVPSLIVPYKLTDNAKLSKSLEKTKSRTELEKLAKKYAYLGYRFFEGSPLTVNDLIIRKKSLSKKVKSKSEKINNLSTRTKNLINLASEIAYLRGRRLEIIGKSNRLVLPLFNKIAEHIGLTFKELIYLTKEEIVRLLNGENNISLKKEARRRLKFKIMYIKDNNLEVISYKDPKIISQLGIEKRIKTSHLQGQVAFPGKVRGVVTVINDNNDFPKFKRGNVLVTQSTAPDYITVIEKSIAIVTDVGGITSHAAIVSRELGIPCIIGTKIATKVLKNGDYVEVNANKGVVKILKRK